MKTNVIRILLDSVMVILLVLMYEVGAVGLYFHEVGGLAVGRVPLHGRQGALEFRIEPAFVPQPPERRELAPTRLCATGRHLDALIPGEERDRSPQVLDLLQA